MRACPALFVSAPASGQGKTTVTAAIARLHRNLGRRVRVFKTGPDFLDPTILERASGNPVYQLDLWMGGERHCRQLLHGAATEADLILIEGVMGLFDGHPSSADLATRFGVPVLAVIDASAMAQTFGALSVGLAGYRPDLPFAGVLANRVGSSRHAELLRDSLSEGIHWFGAIAREDELGLPERHLGLVQAADVADLETRLEHAAARIGETAAATLPPAVEFAAEAPEPMHGLLKGVRIAVARDAAFGFVYPANLELLERLGARLAFFSPLADSRMPEADSLYLPGGYPELHLRRLAENTDMAQSIRAHHRAGRPIVAECGGLMYACESLTDQAGNSATMLGLLPGHTAMQARLQAVALQSAELPEGTLRGHSFHHSQVEDMPEPAARGACPNGGRTAEAVYREGRLTASYIHWYFPSAPAACAELFRP